MGGLLTLAFAAGMVAPCGGEQAGLERQQRQRVRRADRLRAQRRAAVGV